MREFAAAMAQRGHHVVLLTETLDDDDSGTDINHLAEALATHDWSGPFTIACHPVAAPLTRRLQQHRLPAMLSKPTAAWCYLVRGGVFWTWTAASRPFWPVLARSFAPDIVWATFGNVDALNIARGIARTAGCHWVLDIKDPWDAFVPAPLRAAIASRYADAAALTALSHAHLQGAAAWFGMTATVVYSGIASQRAAGSRQRPDGVIRLLLSGGTYDRRDLARLVDAIGGWLARPGAPTADRVALCYAGDDHGAVAEAARSLTGRCQLDIRPFVPADTLAALQDRATANLYVKGRATPFHHKLIELLAAGRPVICLPPDTAETARIAAEVNVPFFPCPNAAAVGAALDAICAQPCDDRTVDREALARYTWAEQAAVLERTLMAAMARQRA